MTLHHLDRIEEVDQPGRAARFGTWFLASSGGAAVVIACVLLARRSAPPAQAEPDPLAKLVAEHRVESPNADEVQSRELGFPRMLSDEPQTTTALAAVKDARGRLIPQADPPGTPGDPPPPTDRLPVVPLPAGTLLNSTPVTRDPKDALTRLAQEASTIDDEQGLAPPGGEGGFQIQVASFRSREEADTFVKELRRRGHRASRQEAQVPERGLWHRVRIGPFKTNYEAVLYRAKLEQAERISAFVVDPEKVKRAEELRAQKLAARAKADSKLKARAAGKPPKDEQRASSVKAAAHAE